MDPSVIGASFTFNGLPFTVIGVAPPKFYGDRMDSTPAFWIPLNAEAIDRRSRQPPAIWGAGLAGHHRATRAGR